MVDFIASLDGSISGDPTSVSWLGSFETGFNVFARESISNDFFDSVAFGNDTLLGQGGDDLLLSALGTDTIAGGDGADYIGLAANGSASGDAGNDFIYGKGFALDNFSFGPYSYSLFGGDGNDELLGTNGGGVIVLSGNAGNDRLLVTDTTVGAGYRGAGTDVRYRPQSVTLRGGAGDDYLESEWAAVMTGGVGADVFHLSRSSLTTRHLITDFDERDKLAFNQSFGSLSIRQSGANTVIRDRTGMVLAQLQNVQASTIGQNDFSRADSVYLHG